MISIWWCNPVIRRRTALAKLMAEAPGLMLLDEPTNHLDIEVIAWLERELGATRAGFVLISHDRAFLKILTRATLWIDRGQVRRQEKGFDAFEAWRDQVWEEDTARHKLDRKIKSEARWAVEGIRLGGSATRPGSRIAAAPCRPNPLARSRANGPGRSHQIGSESDRS